MRQPDDRTARSLIFLDKKTSAEADVFSLLSSSCCKAIAAVDGTVAGGLERNLAFGAALGADSVIHGALSTNGTLAGSAAGLAALGLVFEATLCVEFLLTCGEDELLTAVFAN